MNQSVRQTHLEYYREHQITPVRYDLSSVDAHFQRRGYLYTKLGLLPLAFKHASVLEVAAGTGHNSLYLAQLMPSDLTLLEPNEWGLKHLYESYENFDRLHTKPAVVTCKLEEYVPANQFDIVLCENWLGNSPHELSLLSKIGSMVKMSGMLVVTTVSPIGFVPNLLRRLISIYLAPPSLEFDKRTDILVEAFDSHLSTLSSMTRNKMDWVQDNMLNPAYFGLCLSIPELIDQLGKQFDVVGTSPSFAEDWRWFKGQHGERRDINEHFLNEYYVKAHNFLDHREQAWNGSGTDNMALEEVAIALLELIRRHEDYILNNIDSAPLLNDVLIMLDRFIELVPANHAKARDGLIEARKMLATPMKIDVESIKNMKTFSSLFGRETVYISMTRIMP